MFADRARQVDPHFTPAAETGPMVERLVQRLDGMPLAIELAAARVESLGVSGLLERLDDRLALLAGGDRMAPARLRSLAAAVDWSYRLLGQDDQRVFRRLAMFPGPFTLEAAVTVAGPGAGPVVLYLVDCSLLTPPRAGLDGRDRYLMLETLRAFGLDRLEAPVSGPGPRPRWPSTRCRWSATRTPGCRPAPGRRPRPGGWTPRTRPCTRPWPGPWSTTRRRRCAWPSPWPPGGMCEAGPWPGTGC